MTLVHDCEELWDAEASMKKPKNHCVLRVLNLCGTHGAGEVVVVCLMTLLVFIRSKYLENDKQVP